MKKRGHVACAVLAAVALVVAPSITPSPATAASRDAAPVAPSPMPATIDEVFAATASEVPGFGGAYVVGDATLGEQEHLFIWLTQPDRARASSARDSLVRRGLGSRFDKADYTIRVADYDYTQLYGWHQELHAAFGVPGVAFLDVDEQRNRLAVGIADLSMAAQVRDVATARGIPTAAIEFLQASGFRPHLRSERRPMRGGLQISFQTGGFGLLSAICSLGFPAVRSGVNGFVTNSHCSRTQGEVDNGRYWQPDRPFLDGNQVGTETVDPGYFTGGSCPSGFRCRQSDSNFVRAHDASHIVRGTIARIGTVGTTWNGTSLWRVTGAGTSSVNEVATKVGRTTGLTSGLITHSCVSVQQEGSDIVMLCEHIAEYQSDGGDSGAPVFRVTNSPSTHDVAALGVHWGGGTVDGVDSAVYSDLAGVSSEIGSLTVCASGFSC